jgi:hypothetical protein
MTTTRDIDGMFIVNLPIMTSVKMLGRSKEMAKSRFCKLEERFSRNFHLKQEYVNFMDEYLEG